MDNVGEKQDPTIGYPISQAAATLRVLFFDKGLDTSPEQMAGMGGAIRLVLRALGCCYHSVLNKFIRIFVDQRKLAYLEIGVKVSYELVQSTYTNMFLAPDI